MEQAMSGPNMGQYMLFYKVKNQVSRLYEWEKGDPQRVVNLHCTNLDTGD